jgi:chemotaxis family two-component system response regulator Rcp1
MTRDAPVEILLVEDNPADVRLTVEALRSAGVDARLHVAGDGVEALARLRRQGTFGQAARPHLVLLDLNLPKKNGREVLAEMKRDPALASIPVVVLTTSAADEDVARSYALHANSYVVKPVEFARFVEAMLALVTFWVRTATLPSTTAAAGVVP